MKPKLVTPEKDIFLAAPNKPGRVVLVIHSWWGFTDTFRDLCVSLANRGYLAVAVDLFSGGSAQTEAQARKLKARRRAEPIYKTLVRALSLARQHPMCSNAGAAVLGFSMGGHWAFWLSHRPEYRIDKVVSFYAVRNTDFTSSIAEYQIHLAEGDPWVSKASLKSTESSMRKCGRPYVLFQYPGTRHWFFETEREEYDRRASALAFGRVLEFLKVKRSGRNGV